jgi:hypothetical protein
LVTGPLLTSEVDPVDSRYNDALYKLRHCTGSIRTMMMPQERPVTAVS